MLQPSTQPTPPSLAKRFLRPLAIRLLVLTAILLTIRFTALAESLAIYFPSRNTPATPATFEEVTITTPDGKTLHAWFMRATDARPGEVRPAILHCHGNAGNIASHTAFSEFLTHHSFHVLIFDYRGYGNSSPTSLLRRDQLNTDTLAALKALMNRPDVDPTRIGTYGVSLGSVFALSAAAQTPTIRAVCTAAAFSSWSDIAADKVPILGRILMPTGLDPKDLATRLPCPYLIVHGDADTIVPISHADTIETAARAHNIPTTRYTAPALGHNEEVPDSPATQQAIINFFTQHLANELHTLPP